MAITGTDMIQWFSEGVYPRLEQLVMAPINHGEILWTILPLLITALMIEVYFGRHKTEELGWNSAFANCISLLWVTTALIRFMYEEYGSWVFVTWDPMGHTPTVLMIMVLGVWAFMLAMFNYYHVLPKGVSFLISSAIPVNITALLMAIIVIGKIRVDPAAVAAAVVLFIGLAILLAIIEAFIKPSPEAQAYIEEYREHAAEMQQQREQKFVHGLQMGKHRVMAQLRATHATIKHIFGFNRKD